jgi:GT2 family glycosyltransferase
MHATPSDAPQGRVRILAVVVVYKMRPGDSPTLQSLLETQLQDNSIGLDLSILVQDNTPGGQDPGPLPVGVQYIAAPHNPGLSSAYNRALAIARQEGYTWLLTLDQDTLLPGNFLSKICQIIVESGFSPEIGAIVPRVVDGDRCISPYEHVANAFPRWFPEGTRGIMPHATYAINSTATLKVDTLHEIGGYDPLFPLDISDISMFHRLHQAGKKVFLVGELTISHDFSILKRDQRMSIDRYRSLLLDECAFWDMYMGPLGRMERLVRLAGRACKETLHSGMTEFRRVTLGELKRRLITPRSRRIAEWQEWAAKRRDMAEGR